MKKYMPSHVSMQKYAPIILRIGMSLVFFIFAYMQLTDPYNFIGYLPDFLFDTGFARQIVYANAIFEILFGLLLILGLFTRLAAFLLAVHLAVITYEIGFRMDGIRDFGLTVATFAIWLNGPDAWSLDKKWRKKK